MGKKDDADNRSNQLNPNNSAYATSRGWGFGDDDDNDDRELGLAPRTSAPYQSAPITQENSKTAPDLVFVINVKQQFLLRYINNKGCLGQVILESDSPSDAVNELRELWERSKAWYVKLLDGHVLGKRTILFEEKRTPLFSEAESRLALPSPLLARKLSEFRTRNVNLEALNDDELLEACKLSKRVWASLRSLHEYETGKKGEFYIHPLDFSRCYTYSAAELANLL